MTVCVVSAILKKARELSGKPWLMYKLYVYYMQITATADSLAEDQPTYSYALEIEYVSMFHHCRQTSMGSTV